ELRLGLWSWAFGLCIQPRPKAKDQRPNRNVPTRSARNPSSNRLYHRRVAAAVDAVPTGHASQQANLHGANPRLTRSDNGRLAHQQPGDHAAWPVRSRFRYLDHAAPRRGHNLSCQHHICLLVSAPRSLAPLGQRAWPPAEQKRAPPSLSLVRTDSFFTRCDAAALDRRLRADVHETVVLRDPICFLDRIRTRPDRFDRTADRAKDTEP